MPDDTRMDDVDNATNVNRDELDGNLTTAELAAAGINRRSFFSERTRRETTEVAETPKVPDAVGETSLENPPRAGNGPLPARPPSLQTAARARTNPQPAAQTGAAAVMAREKAAPDVQDGTPLFPAAEAADFRARWDNIQVRFIDEPRHCVEQADALVAETMQRLAETFAKERENLEHQWDRGADVSTEDLRLALRRYRSFFGRLMQV